MFSGRKVVRSQKKKHSFIAIPIHALPRRGPTSTYPIAKTNNTLRTRTVSIKKVVLFFSSILNSLKKKKKYYRDLF